MILPLSIFALTVALILLRPRGLPEAIWPAFPMMVALALVAFGFIGIDRVMETLSDGASALTFLFALLVYGALLERGGFFEWAALHGARLARGSVARLFRNFYLLAAFITITLSLDTTAVLLTPIVLALARRLRIAALPFLMMTIFVANAGSLLLPVSNLTNILFAARFELGAGEFLRWMAAPQLITLALLYAALRLVFRKELKARFSIEALPDPAHAIGDRGYFMLSLASFPLIGAGYAFAPSLGLSPAAPLFLASLLLIARGLTRRQLEPGFLRALPWGLFPLVFGLFILVRFIGDAGLLELSAEALAGLEQGAEGASPRFAFLLAALIGLATNIANNLPVALFIQDVFGHELFGQLSAGRAGEALLLFAALIGANIGPLLTPFGSLATLLILSIAARGGERVPALHYLRLAGLLTPPLFLAAMGALLLAEAAFWG